MGTLLMESADAYKFWLHLWNLHQMDPVLRYKQAEHRLLVRKLLEVGTCDLTVYPKEKIGLFVV